ncbi:DUF461 domain-containing protein [Streptomyces paludis]|uniref:DUF461 domain-containing protein n=1 Tax=Streptomyces paludis TaxID=2282738 RepID=A0A345HRN7_9ACTN|nr:DUF461 domain-containing protein [Streptomyces paludis]AXG79361.1 DUF461 domain-containing protein [Streptomyces paludis]
MSRSLRRGALAATALVLSLAPLTACGAGNNAQTLGVKPDSAATSVGDIKIQNATVVTQPTAGADGPAVVTGMLFNSGQKDQTLDSITLPDAGVTVKLTPAKGSGPITVPALGSVQLGGAGNASAVIAKGREAGKDGDVQKVVFSFSETGEVSLGALVYPARSYFEGVGPSALPTPTATTSPSATKSPEAGSGDTSETSTDANAGSSGADANADEESVPAGDTATSTASLTH